MKSVRKVTIKEIAQMAGVSPTTVSFVINDRPGVSDKVRERVREIIRREQFTPSLSSRRLVQGRSYNICFMFHQTSSPFSDLFYWELAKSLLDACNEYGYNMMLCEQAAKGGDDPVPDIIRQRDVDAVVCFQSMHDAVQEALREHGIARRHIPHRMGSSRSHRRYDRRRICAAPHVLLPRASRRVCRTKKTAGQPLFILFHGTITKTPAKKATRNQGP